MSPLINTLLFASLPAGNIAFTQTRKCHVPSRAALSSRISHNKLQREKREGHKTHMHYSTAQPGRHAARRRGWHRSSFSAASTVGETVSEEEDQPRQSQGLCREDYRPSIEGRIYHPIRLPSNGSNGDSSSDYQAAHAHAHNTHNTSASKPTSAPNAGKPVLNTRRKKERNGKTKMTKKGDPTHVHRDEGAFRQQREGMVVPVVRAVPVLTRCERPPTRFGKDRFACEGLVCRPECLRQTTM